MKKEPSLGALREEVALQSRTVSTNSFGEAVATWSTQATVAAEVIPTASSEQMASGEVRSATTYLVTMRFYPGLTPKWRMLWGGKTLQVQSAINPDGRQRWHEVVAVEETN